MPGFQSMQRLHAATLAVAAAAALTLAPGRPASAQQPPKVEHQTHCPVFTDRIVGFSSMTIRYRGVAVKLSGTAARIKWLRSPESFLDAQILPQLQDLKLPARPIEQAYCPVYRDRKVSYKDPFVIHDGKKVYFFDELARRRWQINAQKYLDLDLLPQLRPPEIPEEFTTGDEELDALLEALPGSPPVTAPGM